MAVFKPGFSSFKTTNYQWSLLTMAIALLLAIPIFTILFKLFDGPGESWEHITRYLLGDYISNSLSLVFVCSILSLLMGVLPAWLVSRYHFPFRKSMEWLLILPLAIPNYLTAYAYAGIFDYGGAFQNVWQWLFGENATLKIDIMNVWGLAFILSASLYPYVYVAARSFFLTQSAAQLKAAQMLGAGKQRIFWKIALPMARPAIIGGLLLVLMEVLNDYGATYYYNVSTFTTAIFRSWFALEEPETSVYLSALLCLMILLLILAERFQRRRKRYQFNVENSPPAPRQNSAGLQKYWHFLLCVMPVLLGFVLPVVQLSYWAFLTGPSVWNDRFTTMIGHSFLLSAVTAGLCILFCILLIYGVKWSRSLKVNYFSRMAILGYAVPGVVIAVGIMIPSLAFDKWMVRFAAEYFDLSIGFLINGTIIGLVFAYCVRFLAVSYHPIDANVQKIGDEMGQAAQMLGASKWRRMKEINLPLLQKGLLSGALLVFVDVMKELPLTLLLKPYNIITLSTKAYEYASDERIAETALPALCIIATGLLPIILLNRLIRE